MPAGSRVYVVEDSRKIEKPRLVRATYAHIAERHVIAKYITARVASKDDLIKLLSEGARVEETDELDGAVREALHSSNSQERQPDAN